METVNRAVREGWLVLEDPLDILEHEIIPKVAKNLSMFLDQGDKQVTIETAKGTLFKAYQESKGISQNPTTVLALKIEPAAPDAPQAIIGQIIGIGRSLTAPQTDDESNQHEG